MCGCAYVLICRQTALFCPVCDFNSKVECILVPTKNPQSTSEGGLWVEIDTEAKENRMIERKNASVLLAYS